MIAPWHGVGRDHEGESLISSADLAAGSTPLKPVMEAPNTAPTRYSVPVLPNTAPGQSFLAQVGPTSMIVTVPESLDPMVRAGASLSEMGNAGLAKLTASLAAAPSDAEGFWQVQERLQRQHVEHERRDEHELRAAKARQKEAKYERRLGHEAGAAGSSADDSPTGDFPDGARDGASVPPSPGARFTPSTSLSTSLSASLSASREGAVVRDASELFGEDSSAEEVLEEGRLGSSADGDLIEEEGALGASGFGSSRGGAGMRSTGAEMGALGSISDHVGYEHSGADVRLRSGGYGDESGRAAPVVDDDELAGLDASRADLKLAPLVASAKARLEASAAVGAVPAAVDAVPEPPEADVAMEEDGRRDEASKEVPSAMEVDSAADERAAVEDANADKLCPADVSVPLQEYVIKERKEKAPKAEKKKKEKPPVDEMTRFWTKAERDRALKAASNLGISDLERFAHALGRPAPVARSFADGLLVSLLGALEAPQAAAGALKDLPDTTLGRSFWGFEATPDMTPSPPPLPAVKAVAADEAAAGGAAAATEAAREAAAPKTTAPKTTAPTTASTTAPSLVWALLPEDVKFDEALRKGAVRTLQRLLWMRTLYELRVPAAEAAAPAVAVAPAEGTPADAADATENTETAATAGGGPRSPPRQVGSA